MSSVNSNPSPQDYQLAAQQTAAAEKQMAEKLLALTKQANTDKSVTGDQIRALKAQVDQINPTLGSQLGSAGKSINAVLNEMAQMADAEQQGKPLAGSDQQWAKDITDLTTMAGGLANMSDQWAQAYGDVAKNPQGVTSASATTPGATAASTQVTNDVQNAVRDNKSPWTDDQLAQNAKAAGFTDADGPQKYAMQLITRDVMSGADPVQLGKDMRIAYQAYSNVARNGTNINGSVNDFAANLESAIRSGSTGKNADFQQGALDAVKNWHAAILQSPSQTTDLTYLAKDNGVYNTVA